MVNDTRLGSTAWDSGVVASAATVQVVCGATLNPDTVYTAAVAYWDAAGVQSPWSEPLTFATGLLDPSVWDATGSQWIGCPNASPGNPLAGSGYNQLRTEFTLQQARPGVSVVQARAYISGLGWYLAWLNGQKLGNAVLEPAFTTLGTRVLYTGYNVTGLLNAAPGAPNALAIMLGGGWPAVSTPFGPGGEFGPIPWNGSDTGSSSNGGDDSLLAWRLQAAAATDAGQPLQWQHSGYQRRTRALLIVHYSDGSNETVVTSAAAFESTPPPVAANATSWLCGRGKVLNDSLYDGATIDNRYDTVGWQSPQYDYATGNWTPAIRITEPGGVLVATDFPPVVEVLTIPAQSMWISASGKTVVDFGQNAAGYVRITLPAPTEAGWFITVRHAELRMHPPYGVFESGELYYDNLRSAAATDYYVTGSVSEGAEVLQPVFTWHGFRYAEISAEGLPITLTPEMVELVHIRNNVQVTGDVSFPPSANVLNQLQRAIHWGQASNFMGNPSDCPQRDERLGWTGDSAITNEESSFNFDTSALYNFWVQQIADGSTNMKDSNYPGAPGFVPITLPDVTGKWEHDPWWQTVWPTNVHTMYKFYGDLTVATEQWPGLMRYVDLSVANITRNGGIQFINATYGDWCPPPAVPGTGQGPKPSIYYTAGAAFMMDLQNLIEVGTALGNNASVAYFSQLLAGYVSQFNTAWLNASTGVYGNQGAEGLQTAQSVALGLGLVPPGNVTAAVDALVADITGPAHDYHMSVGIIGMKFLHRALTDAGRGDLAVNITCALDYPGFASQFNDPYEPGTTLWEVWDAPAEGPGMNSRNHIMEGSIGAWLYTHVLGINQAPASNSFSDLLIAPAVTTSPLLPSATGSYSSIRGTITVSWSNDTTTHSFSLLASVPVNTQALLVVPTDAVASTGVNATESGVPFFVNGVFVPGAVAGVTSAAFNAGTGALAVQVGSGLYEFVASWAA